MTKPATPDQAKLDAESKTPEDVAAEVKEAETAPSDGVAASRPTTRTKRFMKLAGMTASVATRHAGSRIKNLFRRGGPDETEQSEMYRKTGEKIAATLGELKGAVMKVGQIASQAKDFLPKEVSEALKSLQREAPPMEFSVIAAQIEKELGKPPHELFAYFDESPFGSASIGQVHRARMEDGREVVVKIQYPGVDESVDSDLKHMRTAFRLSGLIKLDKKVMDQLFNEFRDRLLEELDYENEAENVQLFREFHKDDEGIVIPDVVEERTTTRILTLTYEEGDYIDDVKSPSYEQQTIDLLGHRLFHIMGRQIFELHAIHSDPHPGNFAFRPDGTIVFYDFGCVKKLKPEIVSAYRDGIVAGLERNYEGLEHALKGFGARKLDGPPVDPEYYWMWHDLFMKPFLGEPFDFGASKIHENFAKKGATILKYLDSFQPPVETSFLDRIIGGHYWTMHQLGVVADFLPVLKRFIALPQVEYTLPEHN